MNKKIPDISGLVKKKTNFNTKVTEIEGKIPNINGLATGSELTAVKNKIPDVSSLDYNTKISETENKVNDHNHDKYITPELNTLAAWVFNARLAKVNLVTKTGFDAKLKKISDRVTSNKSKYLLVENELKKLEKFDSSHFWGRNYFEGNNGAQNTLVFQLKPKYIKLLTGAISE